jgi:hypothetical protein
MAIHGEKMYDEFVKALHAAFTAAQTRVHFPLWIEQIGSRLAGLANLTAADNSAESEICAEAGALDTFQIAEGEVWLDPSIFDQDDVNSVEEEDVGAVFTVDDGQPPTQIKGSHPACTSAIVVHKAQGKTEWTNNNDKNEPMESLSDELQTLKLNVARNQKVSPGVIPEVEETVDRPAVPNKKEDVSALVSRYLEKPQEMGATDIATAQTGYALGKFSDWLGLPHIQDLVSKFNKIKGTLCCRFTMVAPTDTSCGALVRIAPDHRTNAANGSEFSFGDCELLDAQRNSVVVIKRRVDNLRDFVQTYSTSYPRTDNLSAEAFVYALRSPVTPPAVKIYLQMWMEDAVVAVPTAQGVVNFPICGPEHSNNFFASHHTNDFERNLEAKTYLTTTSWESTINPGTRIWGNFISDAILTGITSSVSSLARHMTYDYMTVMFKCVKTPFHRGKLRISVGDRGDPTKLGQHLHVIWDISTQDTFTVKIPYSFLGPHQSFKITELSPYHPYIDVQVQENLVCPESVVSTVDVAVFTSLHGIRIIGDSGEYAEAQGLLPGSDSQAIDYEFPLTPNKPPGGATVWEMMKKVLTEPRPFECDPAPGADADCVRMAVNVVDWEGWIDLLRYFTYWTGTLHLDIRYGTQYTAALTAALDAVSLFMCQPFSGQVAICSDDAGPVPTGIEHPGKGWAAMGGETQYDSVPPGGFTRIVLSPTRFGCGHIDDTGKMLQSAITAAVPPNGTFPSFFLSLSLGEDFQVAGPSE